jgi:hypothetical protein
MIAFSPLIPCIDKQYGWSARGFRQVVERGDEPLMKELW